MGPLRELSGNSESIFFIFGEARSGTTYLSSCLDLLHELFPTQARYLGLLVEAGCVLFFLSRRVSVGLLLAVIFFHIGVVVLYGFFFWTWILLDAGLLALLLVQSDVLDEIGSRVMGLLLFLSHRDGVVDTGSERVKEVVVHEVTTWFDGERPREIRVLEVARIVPGG
jgi:hypothetical protein